MAGPSSGNLKRYLDQVLETYQKYLRWAYEDGDELSQQYWIGSIDAIKSLEMDFLIGDDSNRGPYSNQSEN